MMEYALGENAYPKFTKTDDAVLKQKSPEEKVIEPKVKPHRVEEDLN